MAPKSSRVSAAARRSPPPPDFTGSRMPFAGGSRQGPARPGQVGSEDALSSGRLAGVLVCLRPLSPLRACPSERHEPYPHADAAATQPRQEAGVTTTVAVKIRLKRMGKIHAPFYRVVIMNSRTDRKSTRL